MAAALYVRPGPGGTSAVYLDGGYQGRPLPGQLPGPFWKGQQMPPGPRDAVRTPGRGAAGNQQLLGVAGRAL